MKQIHKPYYTWECYKNGMFDIDKKQNEDLLIKKSELLLCNEDVFFKISLLEKIIFVYRFYCIS